MDREYMQEVINGMRKIVKPYLAKQLKKINFEGCGNTDKAEFETDFEIVLTLAEHALAIPSAEPKWIPVSERLPEEETDVLICNRNGDIALSRGSYSTEVENDFIWYTSGWRFGKVVAWMPLPSPYKAESEE